MPVHLGVIALGGLASTGAAASQPTGSEGPHARPTLYCAQAALTPGQTTDLGIHFTIDKDWHLYWNGLNDSGLPPEIAKATLPAGYSLGEVQWPAPKRHLLPGNVLDHIYEDSVTLVVPLHVPATAKGEAEITLSLSWLVCSEACIPEDAEVKLTIPVRPADSDATPSTVDPRVAKLFADARSRRPQVPMADALTVSWSGDEATVGVRSARQLAFFPAATCTPIAELASAGVAKGDTLKLQLEPDSDARPMLKGILEVQLIEPAKTVWYWIERAAPDRSETTTAKP